MDKESELLSETECKYLIIGASFAGSLLAAKLAKHGKTVLVDKYPPGTLMNCAGGMPEKTFHSLDLDIPYKQIKSVKINLFGKMTEFPLRYVVVDRSQLDSSLCEKAKKAGAVYKTLNYQGHNAAKNTASLKHKNNTEEISYKKLILANGLHPRKREFGNKDKAARFAYARVEILEGESPYADSLYINVSRDNPIGYSWIFPMTGNSMNIGSGGFNGIQVPVGFMNDFKSSEKLNGKILKKGGGILPVAPAGKVSDGTLSIFGDAAGMVFPLNGEGLKHISDIADKWADAIVKERNLNVTWKTSSTYLKMALASIVLRIFMWGSKVSGRPIYGPGIRFAVWIRRTFPNSWFPA